MINQPTFEQKRKALTVVAVLPLLADYMEDMELFRKVKVDANFLIKSIRNVDGVLMDTPDSEVHSQIVDIQRAFHQFMKEHFKEEL